MKQDLASKTEMLAKVNGYLRDSEAILADYKDKLLEEKKKTSSYLRELRALQDKAVNFEQKLDKMKTRREKDKETMEKLKEKCEKYIET